MLGPLEVVALIVANSGPDGLASFITRSAMRDLRNVLGRRPEVLCAFNLAVQRLPYAFGRPANGISSVDSAGCRRAGSK
jgi:hypothetical protein